jgi:regulator of protease activity HflC (stomatin/prohibitin superfamily)
MPSTTKYVVWGVIALFSLVMASCGIHTVDTGHRGVQTRFGKVVSGSLPEGIYFMNPFTTHLTEMDTRILRSDGETEAYTKDVQEAKIKYTLNYRLRAGDAPAILQSVGVDWADKLVPQIVLGTLKEVTGQWDAVALISNRQQAGIQAAKAITDTLADRSIDVTRFEITDLEYSERFNSAIEAKVIAQQKAIEETNRTAQIEQQAKQRVITAESEAKSMQIRAQALETNPKLVEWEAVQKWDGHMPQYMLGGAMPFIQLPAK